MKYFVAVAGNIGAGKTSLAALLAQKLGWEPFFEPVEENPYLTDFYQDMRRWGFHSQVFFLARRLRQYRGLLDRPGSIIQDRSVYEDAEVFACNLYRQGYMSERDWNSYHDLYEAVTTLLPPPNLVVYLQTSVPALLRRIASRGRDIEHSISAEYLMQLNDLYESWIAGFNLCPVLTVATDDLDFAHDAQHLDQIARRIVDRLQGKETITLTPL
jgi:deoxyadenosine/deoxycytidine kinase